MAKPDEFAITLDKNADAIATVWSMPLSLRIRTLFLSVAESSSKDIGGIVNTCCSMVATMARHHSVAVRLSIADQLRQTALTIERDANKVEPNITKSPNSYIHELLALVVTKAEALPAVQRYLAAESCRDAGELIEVSVLRDGKPK